MSDDDAPRIRLWGDSTRGHRIHPGTDRKPESAAPVDLASVRVTRATEPQRPTQTRAEPTSLVVRIATDDGAPLPSKVELVATGETVSTDADGLATFTVAEGPHELRFVEPPKLGPFGDGPTERTILVEAHRTESFWLSTGTARYVVVRRPRTTEIMLDGYAQGSVVMRWGGTRPRLETVGGVPIPVVGTARGAAAAFLIRAGGRHALVIGHADPQGSDLSNAGVALSRAFSTHLYLSGRHEEWAEHAAAKADETDFACALSAFAAIVGIDRPALDDEHALEAVCAELHRFGGDATGRMSSPYGTVDEWRLVAEAYDIDLAKLLGLEVFDLERLRERITWIGEGVAELGETWPRDPIELDDASQVGLPYVLACRRSSLHVMGPGDAEAVRELDRAALETIYDGTFAREIVETPTEVVLRIRCTDPKGDVMPGARVWLRGPLGVNAHVADATGIVTTLALRGTTFTVVAARGSDHSGTLLHLAETEIP